MFGVWQGTPPRRSHTNNTPCRSSAIFCHTTINPYDAVIGLWWHPWTNRRGSLFHWWKSHFLLSLKGSVCAGMSSQVMAGSEPLPLCHARPQTHSFVRGYAPPCYFLNSHWVSTRSRWASACSRSWMKNQPGTHLLHLLSCLLHYFLPLRRKTISASPGTFFFTVQAVIFHVTLLLLVLVFSAGTWNIFSVMFHGPCCMRLRPGYIWKSCFSLIFSHPPTTFIIFIPFFMLKSTSALDEFIWFGFCWHKWD